MTVTPRHILRPTDNSPTAAAILSSQAPLATQQGLDSHLNRSYARLRLAGPQRQCCQLTSAGVPAGHRVADKAAICRVGLSVCLRLLSLLRLPPQRPAARKQVLR